MCLLPQQGFPQQKREQDGNGSLCRLVLAECLDSAKEAAFAALPLSRRRLHDLVIIFASASL
jgi:hypothetical protein